MDLRIEQCAQLGSVIHRWDARWKFAAFVLLTGVSATVGSLTAAATASLVSLASLSIARLPVNVIATRLGAVHLFLVPCFIVLPFSAPGQEILPGYYATREGVNLALLLYLRAVAVVSFSIALVYTTPMNRLLQAIEALYCPKTLVQIALLTFRYIHTLWVEFVRIRCALAVRAFENRATMRVYQTWANVIGMTLVRSLERTERVHHAMKCRGYDGRIQRLHTFQTQTGDVVAFTVCVILASVLVYANRVLGAAF